MFMGSIQNKAPDDINRIYVNRSCNLNTPHKNFSGVAHLKIPNSDQVDGPLGKHMSRATNT